VGSVVDRWTRPGPSGKRVRSERYGRGKRWLARYVQADGSRGNLACTTKDEALAVVARADVARRSGDIAAPVGGPVLFGDYAALWVSRQVHHRGSTADRNASLLRVHLLPRLGGVRLSAVTRGVVQDVIVDLSKTLAPATTRSVLVLLRSIMRAAVEERLITTDPTQRARLPELSKARVVPMTAEQVHVLTDAVPPLWRPAVVLAAASGMRSGELRGLTWDRVDGDLVTVDRQLESVTRDGRPVWGPPKTASSNRRFRLDERTLKALWEHRGKHGEGPEGLVLLSRTGRPQTRTGASEAWGAARTARPDVLGGTRGWHDLRHFHASVLVSAGVSVRAVADRLGHKSPTETLETYAHLMPSDEERSLAAVESALWA